jgi:methylenetetrahydrofolate dehydrogenase (NADP+)/methenyltetrahydrofolate cyclohydrolase
MATIMDGTALGAIVRDEVRAEVGRMAARGVTPGLAVILAGEDQASAIYVRNKARACDKAGIRSYVHALPSAEADTLRLVDMVHRLNEDAAVDGMLVQLPLPRGCDAHAVLNAVSPDKDVDGFHPINVGLLHSGRPRFAPCTPLGVMRMLDHYGVAMEGRRAVVIGRSNIVGKPMAALLLARHATVTLCHSRTRDLADVVSTGDIVVAAAGSMHLVRGAWIKPGAAVVDVGMHRTESGKLTGDVEFAAAAERASFISPVPGGVGPMTIAMLLANTVAAARARV